MIPSDEQIGGDAAFTEPLDASEASLCALLQAASEAQLRFVEAYLDTCHDIPMGLGEVLEDVGNDYLRLAETIARMQRERLTMRRRVP